MKRLIRLVSLVLVFSILLAIPAYAADNRASAFFSYTSAYLSKANDTTFHVSYHVTGTGGMDEIGVSCLKIQESSNNSTWTTVATYYNLIDTNTSMHAGHVTYTGTANKYYRAYVEFYAKNDTGIGCKPYTTSSIKVP